MRPNSNAQVEGISFITKGMNSGQSPRMLPPDQLAFAINCTMRGGLPRTRPRLSKVILAYTDSQVRTGATTGRFQTASFYQSFGGGQNCLIAAIGGRIFRYNVVSTPLVEEISIPADLNDSTIPINWMWQSEDFLIIQNGQADPLFYDGTKLVRSKGYAAGELPAGCMGAYVQGRNWMVLPDRRSFIGGDLVYSHGYSDGYGGRAAVLQIKENTFISGGGAFAVPLNAGEITAMCNVAIADTSLGQGPLQVMTQTSVYSVQVPLERTQWAAVDFPLMTIGLPNYGAVSQDCAVPINGDIWYRSLDGIRSYQIARRDFNTWVNTPLSDEMEKVIQLDSDQLLGFASGVIFDNRYLITCSPQPYENGVYHQGLIALDFNNISSITTRSNPCYDGLWTGLKILKILKGIFGGRERCFIFALDKDGLICLYELSHDTLESRLDFNGQDMRVESVIESRSMSYADGGNALKKLFTSDMFLDRLSGDCHFEFAYRSDEDPTWRPWHQFNLCALAKDCATKGCPTFQNVQPQFRTYVRMPQPDDDCNPSTGRQYRTGYEFSVRMKVTGQFQLNRLLVWANPAPETPVTACPTSETCKLIAACDESWFTYSLE